MPPTHGPTRRPRRSAHRPASLRKLLAEPGLSPDRLGYHEMQGFLFAVVSAPELAMPAEWLPQLFGKEPEFKSQAQAERVLGATMELYNELNEQVLERRVVMPEGVTFHEDVLANLDEDAPIAAWSRGFKLGHNWLESSWDEILPEGLDQALDDELGTILLTLTFFSSRELAELYRREASRGKKSLSEIAESIRNVFPDALAGYALMGRTLFEAQAAQSEATKGAGAGPSVGRNEPCPCGSGKKFKRCCGR